jgi:chromosome partitioning protein
VQTILVANPKGGSGKTTLATNIAGWLAGKRQKVALADADPQHSSAQWLSRRPALFPKVAAADGERRKDLEREVDWLVVDSAAGVHGDALRDGVRRADILLVPVSPSAFDTARTRALPGDDRRVQGVKDGALAVGLVGMRVDSRTRSAGELDEFLRASTSRASPTCATRRSTSIARATGSRCSTCRARVPSRTGSNGGR